MEISRRGFFKISAAASFGVGLAHSKEIILPKIDESIERELTNFLPEEWIPSVCGLCQAGCGMLVRKVNGKVTGVKGNKRNEISKGALCPKGFAGLQYQFHPQRIYSPLIRKGEGGSPDSFQNISWAQAFDLILERLIKIRTTNRTNSLIIFSRQKGELEWSMARHFADVYGTPNLIEYDMPNDCLLSEAIYKTSGVKGDLSFDFSSANLIVSFGNDWLQTYRDFVSANRGYALSKTSQPDVRSKIIQIEPRYSITAMKSDRWIRCNPAAEGMAALGVVFYMINSGNYDTEFANDYIENFDDLKESISRINFDRIVEITGISEMEFRYLTRELASAKPAIAIGRRTDLFSQGLILLINILTGSFNQLGGAWIIPHDDALEFNKSLDPTARSGLSKVSLSKNSLNMIKVLERIIEKDPYRVEAAFFCNVNPVYNYPGLGVDAIEKIPFSVTFSNFLDETALYSDIVLPITTFFEGYEVKINYSLEANRIISACKPLILNRDVMSTADIFLTLGKNIKEIQNNFLWNNSKEMYEDYVRKTFDSDPGIRARYEGHNEFEKSARSEGVLIPRREIKIDKLDFRFLKDINLDRIKSNRDTLKLIIYFPSGFNDFEGCQMPYLLDTIGSHLNSVWEFFVEVNPFTAEKYNLKGESIVYIENQDGKKIRARVKIFNGIMDNVIAAPAGLGRSSEFGLTKGIGDNPLKLIPKNFSEFVFPVFGFSEVRIINA